jgi:asparagine synthase (glutamine-hydrolysing)
MSGIVAIIPRGRTPTEETEAVALRMLRRMSGRGELHRIQRTEAVVLARCWCPWEPDHAGDAPAPGAGAPRAPVAADASLYRRQELASRLGSARVRLAPDPSVPGCIAAAHRAWGADAARQLDGDFAYAVWNADERTLVCARDFVGRRPLFFARLTDAFVVASSIAAILEYPGCPQELDPASIAAAAAGLFASHTETAYRHISVLPPGHTLMVAEDRVRIARHWNAPRIEDRPVVRGRSLAEGAEELRALLCDAVRERLDPAGATAVWMSGGWDSTAVFGAGMASLVADGRSRDALRPVSISYPPGDPGREDELIEAVARHWNTPIRWLHSSDIPFFDRPDARAAVRDEPFGHPYEMWNRALAGAGPEVGARVALDGVGGDQLFQLSFVNLSDLLRRGRWLALRREWRAKGMRGRRNFWQWAVLPLLPALLRRAAGRMLGPDAARFYLERVAPPWMDREFLARHGVMQRERRNTPDRRRLSPVAYETHWYLTHPYGGHVLSSVTSFALEEGVEVRSPLMDRRVVEFACRRPWSERSWGTETKRLLRAAMEGLLPPEVLAPRAQRTGLTSGYLAQGFRRTHASVAAEAFEDPVLARLGMVDAITLQKSWDLYRRQGDENLGISLYFTLQTELWLRARMASSTNIVF